jgi:hypothetical protein
MSDLSYRQQTIQEKRKQTSFRDFVMEVCSWKPIQLHRQNGIIARFPLTERSPVLCKSLREFYDISFMHDYLDGAPFLDQLADFYKTRPYVPLFSYPLGNENTDFSDAVFGAKNAYLSFSVGAGAENVLYSLATYNNVRNVVSSIHITNGCDNVFQSFSVQKSMNIFYSKYIINSNDLWFCDNMV